jgi:hypothetical protein
LDRAVDQNRELAARLGWTPHDFGALDFDLDLIAAIKYFQGSAILEQTGVADYATYKALLIRRELASVKEGTDEYTPRHPRPEELDRSEFTRAGHLFGVWVHSNRVTLPMIVAAKNKAFRGAFIPHGGDEYERSFLAGKRWGLKVYPVVRRGLMTLEEQVRDAIGTGAKVVVIREDDPQIDWIGVHRELGPIIRRAKERDPDIVFALHYQGATRFMHQLSIDLDAMAETGLIFDVMMPEDHRGAAVEWWMTQSVTAWKKAMRRRDLDNLYRYRVLPVVRNTLMSHNEILRAREHMTEQICVQGYSYSAMPNDMGNGPFFGPLPVGGVRRVDGHSRTLEMERDESSLVSFRGEGR